MALEGMRVGHYQLQRLVGSGGMGEVYLAEDVRIARKVAVKVVKNEADPYPDSQSTKDATRLFEREMKAISSLDHPNILPLYDFGEETVNKTILTYMVMPFRTEGSLVDWLQHQRNGGSVSPQEVVYIVQQAAGALQHAHNRHLMHLDVKPSNFLIRRRDDSSSLPDLLLTDFGIAKFSTATATVSQSIRGTPAYMAPEQWAGAPTAATDQYALAVMAYYLLIGKLPFQGSMQQVMYQHLQVQPPPPSSFNPQILAPVNTVIMRALAKKPEDRFPSIQDFATAFERAWVAPVTPVPPGPATLSQPPLPQPTPPFMQSSPAQSASSPLQAPPVQSTPPSIQTPPVQPTPSPVQMPPAQQTPALLQSFVNPYTPTILPSAHHESASSSLPLHGPVSNPFLAPGQPSVSNKRRTPRLAVIIGCLIILMLAGGGLAFALSRHSVSPPQTSYLPLKSSYSGNFVYLNNNTVDTMQLVISLQDQKGDITGKALFKGDNPCSFTGKVAGNGHMTLTCDYGGGYVSMFDGTIDSSGHIDGIEQHGSDRWHWNLH